jgi:hypothetical protein
MVNSALFLEKFDPFRQLCWRAEGGWLDAKMHDIRAILAFRQFVALAGWLMVQKFIIILSDLPWNDDGVL